MKENVKHNYVSIKKVIDKIKETIYVPVKE